MLVSDLENGKNKREMRSRVRFSYHGCCECECKRDYEYREPMRARLGPSKNTSRLKKTFSLHFYS